MKQFILLCKYEYKKIFQRKLVNICVISMFVLSVIIAASPYFGSLEVNQVKICTNAQMYEKMREGARIQEGRKLDTSLLEEMKAALNQYYENTDDDIMKLPTEQINEWKKLYLNTYLPYWGIRTIVKSYLDCNNEELYEWIPDETQLYEKRAENLEKSWMDNCLTEKEKKFWREKEKKKEVPETFSYTIGWFYLLKMGNEIPLFLSIVIGICLVSVFSEEYTRKTDQVILCTYHGRKLAYHAKMFAGILFGLVFTLVCFVITFVTVYILFGLDGANAPAQFIFTSTSANMTCAQMVLLYYGCLLIMELFYCVAIMILSEITGSNTISLAILICYTMMGLFLNVPGKFRIASQIWGYSPNKISSIYHVFDCRMISIAGIPYASWQIIPVVYILLILMIYFIGSSVYRNHQVKGR